MLFLMPQILGFNSIMKIYDNHLQVLQNSRRELLGFIQDEQKGLFLLLEQMEKPVLDCLKHSWLPVRRINAEGRAKLAIEFRHTDR